MNDNTQLTINDLATIANVIDIACKRGAFGAGEAKDVGMIYDKVSAFVKAALEQSQAQAEADAEKVSTEETPTDTQGE